MRRCWRYLQLSVPSLWCNTFAEMTRSLLFGVARCTLIQCCLDQRLCRLHCWMICHFVDYIWPGASCRTSLPFDSVSLFSTMPLPFTIEQENSHQCSGSVCTRFNTYRKTTCCTELVLYSVPVINVSSEWNAKEHLLCVSLLLSVLCIIRF